MPLSLPPFLHRHPRYSIFLLVVLICSTFLLLPYHASSTVPSDYTKYILSKFRPAGMSLERWVEQEEIRYAEIVQARKQLIEKYGPDPSKVDPFPPGSIFYTLWDFFIPAFNCPHRLDRLGALGDGGKWICGVDRLAEKHTPCIVYSFGVNHDSSFEAAFLERAPNCEIWGYDFSVSEFGPEIQYNPLLSPKAHFFPYALGASDNHNASPPTYTIRALMEKNGHNFIDVLKIDIEGGEFDALAEFVRPYVDPDGPGMPVGQMDIEIHAWADNGEFGKFLKWWEDLERAGLRPFFTEPNLPYVSHLRVRPDLAEYSFINVKEKHALVAEGF